MLRIYFKIFVYLLLATGISSATAGAYEDFFKAISQDDARTVAGLLERGFDPNSRDEKGQTPLYLSLREGAFKSAGLLLAHPQTRIDLANAVGETALMMAALKGQPDWLTRLLDRGARLEGTDAAAWTALHYAASGPDARAVALLLARGALPNARSPNGSTALMMAARYGQEAAVDALLQKGADARLRNQVDLAAADFAKLAGREALAARLQQAAR